MDLKVRVGDIPIEGYDIPVEMTAAKVEAKLKDLEGEKVMLAAPLEGRLRLAPTGSRIVTRGFLRTVLRAVCARCLEEFELPVAEEVFVVYAPIGDYQTEEELEAESLNQELYTGEEIDLWPIVQEQLLLALPIKPLCREDCLGLCPFCGQNRNLEPCQCDDRVGHPGLAGLKDLRDKLPE